MLFTPTGYYKSSQNPRFLCFFLERKLFATMQDNRNPGMAEDAAPWDHSDDKPIQRASADESNATPEELMQRYFD